MQQNSDDDDDYDDNNRFNEKIKQQTSDKL